MPTVHKPHGVGEWFSDHIYRSNNASERIWGKTHYSPRVCFVALQASSWLPWLLCKKAKRNYHSFGTKGGHTHRNYPHILFRLPRTLPIHKRHYLSSSSNTQHKQTNNQHRNNFSFLFAIFFLGRFVVLWTNGHTLYSFGESRKFLEIGG